MDKYKIIKEIGAGSFAVVSKAQNKETGEIVAIKQMKRKFISWDECINLREIKSLRKLEHQSIIKMKEVLKVKDDLNIVFQYMEQNIYQLYQNVKQKGMYMPEHEIKSIIFQTASGLAYMHKHGFFHRDLKPENLLSKGNVLKIADFGLAREIRSRPPFTEYVSTRWYRAPEILLKSTVYNSPVDIYALGCIMAELYLLTPLFCGNSEIDQMNKICAILGTPTQNNWPDGLKLASQNGIQFPEFNPVPISQIIPNASKDAIQLITQMLQWDPSKRPTAQQVLQHPYFQGAQMPSENDTKFKENLVQMNQNLPIKKINEVDLKNDDDKDFDDLNITDIINDIDGQYSPKINNQYKSFNKKPAQESFSYTSINQGIGQKQFSINQSLNQPNFYNAPLQNQNLNQQNHSYFSNTTNRNAHKNVITNNQYQQQQQFNYHYGSQDQTDLIGRYKI